MAKITDLHREALRKLVSKIPRAKRQEIAAEIQSIQELVGDSTDLLNLDLRGSHWATKSEEVRAKMRETWATKRQTTKIYEVNWRGAGTRVLNLAEAAEAVGKTEKALSMALAQNQGRKQYRVGEFDIVTVTKLQNSDIYKQSSSEA